MTRIEPDPTQPKQPDKSLGDLFGELSHEFGELVQTQVELAKSELSTQADKAKKTVGAFAGAGVAGYMALIMLSFAAAWGLTEIVPEGVAFLIVGVIFAIVAGVLYVRAREQAKDMDMVPKQTVDSLKEDVQWARQKMS